MAYEWVWICAWIYRLWCTTMIYFMSAFVYFVLRTNHDWPSQISKKIGIPTCDSNDVPRSAIELSKAVNFGEQTRKLKSKWREHLLFKPYLSTNKSTRFYHHNLYSMLVLWFSKFCPNDKYRRCYDVGFMTRMAIKSTTRKTDRCSQV